jgi:hypothetical protein
LVAGTWYFGTGGFHTPARIWATIASHISGVTWST